MAKKSKVAPSKSTKPDRVKRTGRAAVAGDMAAVAVAAECAVDLAAATAVAANGVAAAAIAAGKPVH
jgi:hypothetical protein